MKAKAASKAIAEDVNNLLARRKESLDAKGRDKSRSLSAEEQKVEEQIGALGEKLRELEKKSPFMDGKLPGLAGKAKGSAQNAKNSLSGEDPFGAMPSERGVLESLSELSSGLDKAQQEMSGQGKGQRPGGQSPGGRGSRGKDVDRSHVEIPGEAEGKQWRSFREDVLKAMREGRYPEDYRQEVERYYEGLIK
jgi:hypothetical protein